MSRSRGRPPRLSGRSRVFETEAQADESTRVASNWLREEKLESVLPVAPKISSGEVVVHKMRELVPA
jgi:hypothetical protein